jgi:serine/threonine protein kinase
VASEDSGKPIEREIEGGASPELVCDDGETGTEESGDVSTTIRIAQTDNVIEATVNGRYRIDKAIGSGGMSTVLKARDLVLDRDVAFKVLVGGIGASKNAVLRFQREARAVARLDHPNIVKVHDFGTTSNGTPYLVMDYLGGTPLATLLNDVGALSAERATAIMRQVCEGLNHASQHGIIHRDVKPANIIVLNNDVVKLVDFGIAKMHADEKPESMRITQTGETFGSPMYMSPEQCRGGAVDSRSDVYSAGCVFYEMLTGSTVAQGDNSLACMMSHVDLEPRPFAELALKSPVSADLEALVFMMSRKRPEDRPTFEEVIDELASITGKNPAPRPKPAAKPKPAPKSNSVSPRKITNAGLLALVALLTVLFAIGGWKVFQQLERQKDEQLAVQYARLAAAQAEQGRVDSALDDWEHLVQVREKHLQPGEPLLTETYLEIGESCLDYGRPEIAIRYLGKAFDSFIKQAHPHDPQLKMRIVSQLADGEQFVGLTTDANLHIPIILETKALLPAGDHEGAEGMARLAHIYAMQKRTAESLAAIKVALDDAKSYKPSRLNHIYSVAAEIYDDAGRIADAAPFYKWIIDQRDKYLDHRTMNVGEAYARYAPILTQLKRYPEAETAFQGAFAWAERHPSDDKELLRREYAKLQKAK